MDEEKPLSLRLNSRSSQQINLSLALDYCIALCDEPKRAHVSLQLIGLHWLPMASRVKLNWLMNAYSGSAPICLNSVIQACAASWTQIFSEHCLACAKYPEDVKYFTGLLLKISVSVIVHCCWRISTIFVRCPLNVVGTFCALNFLTLKPKFANSVGFQWLCSWHFKLSSHLGGLTNKYPCLAYKFSSLDIGLVSGVEWLCITVDTL